MMNCVLSFTPSPSPDDFHRFRLYRFEAIDVYVIHKIRYGLFAGKVIVYHPLGFIFHGHNECLVKGEGEAVLRPDAGHIGIVIIEPFSYDRFGFIRMTNEIVFCLCEGFQETFNRVGVLGQPSTTADQDAVNRLAALRRPDDDSVNFLLVSDEYKAARL